ncbi:MAG: zinc metalloprotease HtpX [Candidatus Omnitrophota bacterium]
MFFLHLRMMLLVTLLFAIVYAAMVAVGTYMGIGNFYIYLLIAFGFMFIQYMVGPKLIEWSMRVRYIKREENPSLYKIVEDQAAKARIPMPRVCIAQMPIPNAFAFGRSISDGRVCVTQGIMQLLDEDELKAVIGHELSHIKNRDVLTITLLSVIPIIMYRLAWHLLFFGGGRRDRGQAALIGLVALVFYFITNLLVLYASRIREYFADRGSIALGNKPSSLATALYKLVYGSARMGKGVIKEAEGFKAFFLNDPSQAMNEIRDLAQIDLDRSGTIDSYELANLRNKKVVLNLGDRMMEAMSTHPNMLKRIQALAQQQKS